MARRQKNRAATLSAVLQLFASGATDPTVEDISEWSGVSTRSIYRYFHHRQQLLIAALAHLREQIEPQLRLDPDHELPVAERITRFAEQRLALHQALAPLTRASRRAVATGDDHVPEPSVDAGSRDSPETHLRNDLLAQFAPELTGRDDDDLELTLAALGLGFGFEGVEHLERSLATDADVIAVFVRHLSAHLVGPGVATPVDTDRPGPESPDELT